MGAAENDWAIGLFEFGWAGTGVYPGMENYRDSMGRRNSTGKDQEAIRTREVGRQTNEWIVSCEC
jgi:hypothetical protein